jgi:hypothetical protein
MFSSPPFSTFLSSSFRFSSVSSCMVLPVLFFASPSSVPPERPPTPVAFANQRTRDRRAPEKRDAILPHAGAGGREPFENASVSDGKPEEAMPHAMPVPISVMQKSAGHSDALSRADGAGIPLSHTTRFCAEVICHE